jgi:hypothetical protein
MGKIPEGIVGPVSGRVAHVIGSSRNGVAYLKGPYKKQRKPSEGAEAANQTKFKMAHQWLNPLLNFVRVGFLMYKKTSGAYNAAKSNLLLNAFENGPDGMFINPAKVKLSIGSLPLPNDIKIELIEGNVFKFSWDPSWMDGTHGDDQAMLVVYGLEKSRAYATATGEFRRTGSYLMRIYAESGATYHTYIAFNSVDRTRQSDSIYLGAFSF